MANQEIPGEQRADRLPGQFGGLSEAEDERVVDKRPRMIQLDGLRAVAALCVVVEHTLPINGERWAVSPGKAGVYLFFVLSGFLITNILLDRRGAPLLATLRSFYTRRFLRIFPLYYTVLLLAVVAGLPDMRAYWPWYAGFLSNFYISHILRYLPHSLGHYWSLAVEEQFYLIWPALVLLTPRRALPWAFTAAILSSPIAAVWFYQRLPGTPAGYEATTANIGLLSVGALLACVRSAHGRSANTFAPWSGALGAAVLAGIFVASRFSDRGLSVRLGLAPTALGIVFLGLIHFAARGFGGAVGRALSWGPLVYLGTISYGLYVLHDFLPQLIGFDWIEKGPYRMALTLAVTLPVAALSWHGFDARSTSSSGLHLIGSENLSLRRTAAQVPGRFDSQEMPALTALIVTSRWPVDREMAEAPHSGEILTSAKRWASHCRRSPPIRHPILPTLRVLSLEHCEALVSVAARNR